jgi:hypothetical protein
MSQILEMMRYKDTVLHRLFFIETLTSERVFPPCREAAGQVVLSSAKRSEQRKTQLAVTFAVTKKGRPFLDISTHIDHCFCELFK